MIHCTLADSGLRPDEYRAFIMDKGLRRLGDFFEVGFEQSAQQLGVPRITQVLEGLTGTPGVGYLASGRDRWGSRSPSWGRDLFAAKS